MANTLKFGNGQWATKEGSTLAYNDENDNYKPLPFDFTRASNATVVNKEGLIETVANGIPRIDFADSEDGALLLEPQRTNILLQSNQFDTTWTISAGIDITSSQSGVGGSNNAWLLKRNSTGSRYIQQSLSLSSAQYSYSVYLKAESTNWGFIWAYDGVASVNAYIDLENGVVGNTAGSNLNDVSIESVGNGWYRVTLIYTQGTTLVRIYPAYSNGDVAIGADNGIYIQYAQLEQGSYPTSYIPTQGTAQTRLAETCSQTPPDGVIGQTEGASYFEYTCNGSDGSGQRIFSLRGSSTSNRIVVFDQLGKIRIFVASGGAVQLDVTTNVDIASTHKVAFRYKLNDFKLYIDGAAIVTETAFTVPTLNSVYVGTSEGFGGTLGGNVKDVKVYNTALSDTELAALTT